MKFMMILINFFVRKEEVTMEVEVRYYYNLSEEHNLLDKLKMFDELKYLGVFYEKTVQYNHPMKKMDFYSKEIDGRFRVRITKNDETDKCMITWKRRLKKVKLDEINKEEEIEVRINPSDYDNLINLLTNVLKLKRIESYERYRHVFCNDEVEIVVDRFPFGLALEIESKTEDSKSEEVIFRWLSNLGLRLENSYKLSWDDKYNELCKSQNKKVYSDVLFGLDMPEVK